MWLLPLLFQVLATLSFRIPLHRTPSPPRQLSYSNSLTNFQNVPFTQGEYYANMTFGTPPQTISLIPDTASGYIYIPSAQCDHSCWGASRFDSSKSTSFRILQAGPVSETSKGAKIDGFLCGETIIFGPFSADNVTFILANSMTLTSYARFEGSLVIPT